MKIPESFSSFQENGKKTIFSERKFREILQLFCADLTSTQIAEVAKVNRNTINRILQLLRERIMEFAEAESCFEEGKIEVDLGPNEYVVKEGVERAVK